MTTKKDAKKRKLAQKRKRQHVQNSSLQFVADKPAIRLPGPLPGMKKLSECLIEVAKPYLEKYSDNSKRTHMIIEYAASAWNISIISEDLREKTLAGFKEKFGKDYVVFRHLMDSLSERKRELFPNDQRIIVDFKLTSHSSGYDLKVSGTLPDRSE